MKKWVTDWAWTFAVAALVVWLLWLMIRDSELISPAPFDPSFYPNMATQQYCQRLNINRRKLMLYCTEPHPAENYTED